MIRADVAESSGLRRRLTVRRLVSIGLPFLAVAVTAWFAVTILQGKPLAAEQGLTPAGFTQATGIEVVHVVLIAGGGAVDLRFRVVDAEKTAAAQAGGPTHLMVVDEDSGTVLRAPFSHYGQESEGGMHRETLNYSNGRTYFHLLTNSEGTLEQGDRVTVVFGHVRLADVVVQ